MDKDMDAQFLCKDCERFNLCRYYDRRKEDSYICKYFHLPENKRVWIPVTTRPMTEEEKENYQYLVEYGGEILTCPLPENGQEVLISYSGNVYIDTFWNDDNNYFENFDIGEIDAWQPLPKPYKAPLPFEKGATE